MTGKRSMAQKLGLNWRNTPAHFREWMHFRTGTVQLILACEDQARKYHSCISLHMPIPRRSGRPKGRSGERTPPLRRFVSTLWTMWSSLRPYLLSRVRQSPRKFWSRPASEIEKVRISHWGSSETFIDEQCSDLAGQAGASPDDIRLGSSGRKSMKR